MPLLLHQHTREPLLRGALLLLLKPLLKPLLLLLRQHQHLKQALDPTLGEHLPSLLEPLLLLLQHQARVPLLPPRLSQSPLCLNKMEMPLVLALSAMHMLLVAALLLVVVVQALVVDVDLLLEAVAVVVVVAPLVADTPLINTTITMPLYLS